MTLSLSFIFPFIVSCNHYQSKAISVKDFGARGDGVHDDSQAIQKAILFSIKQGINCFFPRTKQSYNIRSTIRISLEPNQTVNIISDGAVIKPDGVVLNSSGYNLTSFREHIFLSIGKTINSIRDTSMFGRSVNTKVSITGLSFDGSGLRYSFPTISFDTDINVGLQILAENVTIYNCIFRNIFGYGIRVHNVKNSTISKCSFINVGGRGATPFAKKIDFDGFGDGVYHSLVKNDGNISIDGCTFIGMKSKAKRSRSAITFEYSTSFYKININKVNIKGFAKCIHIEEFAKTIVAINNSNMSDFNFGIANVLNDKSIINIKNSCITTGMIDGNDNGDALAFLNYRSTAKIYVDNTSLNFHGRKQAYQSAVGLVRVRHSLVNGNNTNFFFADGSTIFENCKFVKFGGFSKSFSSNNPKSTYLLIKSSFSNCGPIHSNGEKLKFQIKK